MEELNRILFVANGAKAEQDALAQAAAFAADSRADLLTVMDIRGNSNAHSSVRPAWAASQEPDSAASDGDGACYLVSKMPMPPLEGGPRVKVEPNRNLDDVIEAAKTHDLVIKPANEKRSKLRIDVANEDRKLIRNCTCPVWIVKPRSPHQRLRILAAVDLDAGGLESPSARSIMAHATALAQKRNAILHIVHAWQIRRELELRGRMNVTGLLKEMRKAHRKQLEMLLDEYRFPGAVVHLMKGRPSEVIPTLVERRGIDLVVVGGEPRTGLKRLFPRNSAERLLGSLNCSLLVVNHHGAHRRDERAQRPRSLKEQGRSVVSSAHASP